MSAQKYNEFVVELERNRKGRFIKDGKSWKIKRKWASDRGSVSIHPHEAEWNNSITHNTSLYYELAEIQPESRKEKEARLANEQMRKEEKKKQEAEKPKIDVTVKYQSEKDVERSKEVRKELFAAAKELRINVPKNIKTENLIKKINELKPDPA